MIPQPAIDMKIKRFELPTLLGRILKGPNYVE